MSHSISSPESPDDFGARVFAARWRRTIRLGPMAALDELCNAPPGYAAVLDPVLLRRVWEACARTDPRNALLAITRLPPSAREGIDEQVEAELWARTRVDSVGDLLTLLPDLPTHAKRLAEVEVLREWRGSGSGDVLVLRHFPEHLLAALSVEEIRAAWEKLCRKSPAGALAVLAVAPERLQEALSPERVEVAMLELHAAETALDRAARARFLLAVSQVPERFWTERMEAAARTVFQHLLLPLAAGEDPDNGYEHTFQISGVLHALDKASPALQRALGTEAVMAAWRTVAASNAGVALEVLPDLSPELARAIPIREVEDAWARAPAPAPSPRVRLATLSRLPDGIRARVLPEEMRTLLRGLEQERTDAMLSVLAGLPDDLWALVAEEDYERLARSLDQTGASFWMEDQARALAEGQRPAPGRVVHLAFRILTNGGGRHVLHWLTQQDERLRAQVPPELRAAAWRGWLMDESEHALGDALEWAGVDVATLSVPTAGDGLVAPVEYRPASLEAEIRSAVLETLEAEPERGCALLRETLPASLRPALRQDELQQIWTRLLEENRKMSALRLLEHAPVDIRPRPSTAEMAELLSSTHAGARLAAIRLSPFLQEAGGAVEWEAERPEPGTATRTPPTAYSSR
jgi:hypothetical protein